MILQPNTSDAGLFYYLNMKEFEKEESQKTKKKSSKLTQNQKYGIRDSLYQTGSFPFTLKRIKRKFCTPRVHIDSYEELFNFLVSLNLSEVFEEKKTIDDGFKCVLFPNNYAWISKGPDGHYRYFTRTLKGHISGLDILDIVEIWTGLERSGTLKWLIKELNIKFMEGAWMNEQNQKYLDNLTLIHQFKKIESEYPNLSIQLKPHLKILETLNVIGTVNIKKEEFSLNNHNIFFAASSYLSAFTGEGSPSTMNKVLNLFAILGLINKVTTSDIPTPLLFESRKYADSKKVGNIISFFTIPHLRDVLETAEQISEKLNFHKLYYHGITKERVINLFGVEFASKIYVQDEKLTFNNKRAESKSLVEAKMLESLSVKGYVTKKMIGKSRISKLSQNEKTTLFSEIITEMGPNYSYVRPTKNMMQAFGLKTIEYILIKGDLKI